MSAANAAAPYLGKSIATILDELRADGVRIAYSSRLVTDEMTVQKEPLSSAPINAVSEILADYQLTLIADGNTFLVVRDETQSLGNALPESNVATHEALENITVLASRYELKGNSPVRSTVLSQDAIHNMPDLGDDPIRISQTLPGTAASGVSAKTHFRGGHVNEVGIILNGMQLFDPYHVRDFQNIFSAIDSQAINDVEVFTGGYPTRFGDHLSGIVVLESLELDTPRKTQIGLSVYNASILHAAMSEKLHWLFSARRGNLDLVINDELGKPSYYDLFSEVRFSLTDRTEVSLNALYAEDSVSVVLESEPEEREAATSATRNFQFWAAIDTHWNERLSSQTRLSRTDYSNRRVANLSDIEKLVANASDVRHFSETGISQDWTYRSSPRHHLQWGFAGFSSNATYDYQASASYFGLPALFENQPETVDRTVVASPSGGRYGIYFSDRWQFSDSTTLELGLRWDDQTYTDIVSDSQLSPRIAVLKRLTDDLDLRLSWGRYHQSQSIQDLQVEDGLTTYWAAQRADHYIASLNYRFGEYSALRFEAYIKDIRGVQPRFENLFDPLALIPELAADRVRIDASRAMSTGAEISLSGSRDAYSWWASYTLSKAEDRISGRDVPRSWDQRHALQGGFAWSNEVWDVALSANVHTGWPTTGLNLIDSTADDPPYVAIADLRNDQRLNDFFALNLRVERQFDMRRGRLSAFVEVSNLTDRKNICCLDYDITDGDGEALLLESSPDYWLPLLPAVGVLWEF